MSRKKALVLQKIRDHFKNQFSVSSSSCSSSSSPSSSSFSDSFYLPFTFLAGADLVATGLDFAFGAGSAADFYSFSKRALSSFAIFSYFSFYLSDKAFHSSPIFFITSVADRPYFVSFSRISLPNHIYPDIGFFTASSSFAGLDKPASAISL